MQDLICIDASIVAKWVFPEALQSQALRLRLAHDETSLSLVAPEHFSVERISIVKHKFEAGLADADGARRALRLLFALDVRLMPVSGLHQRVFEIATAIGESAWDAAYIAVAEAEHCDFWTADKELARRAKQEFPFVKLLGEDTLNGGPTP